MNKPVNEKSKPMFVQFVLDNLYKLYNIVLVDKEATKIQDICNNMGLKLNKSDLSLLDKDPKIVLRVISLFNFRASFVNGFQFLKRSSIQLFKSFPARIKETKRK